MTLPPGPARTRRLARPGRGQRPAPAPLLRQRHPPRPAGRHRRPHPALQLCRHGRQRQQDQDDQEANVRPRRIPAPPQTRHPPPCVTSTTELAEEPGNWARTRQVAPLFSFDLARLGRGAAGLCYGHLDRLMIVVAGHGKESVWAVAVYKTVGLHGRSASCSVRPGGAPDAKGSLTRHGCASGRGARSQKAAA